MAARKVRRTLVVCAEVTRHVRVTVMGERARPAAEVALDQCMRDLSPDVWGVLLAAYQGAEISHVPNKAALDTLVKAIRLSAGLDDVDLNDACIFAAAVLTHMHPGRRMWLERSVEGWRPDLFDEEQGEGRDGEDAPHG